VDVERPGETVRVHAPLVVVSCGAINSAALLLRSKTDAWPNGLANSSGLVGKRYMAHLATMMQGFNPARRNPIVFQKTVAINDYYLRGPGRRIRSARSSRRAARTASWRRRSCRGSRSGRTTRGWRAGWTGW
jgi:choline dehydrogenase-like flavoprotein